jgi:hypothetical protein
MFDRSPRSAHAASRYIERGIGRLNQCASIMRFVGHQSCDADTDRNPRYGRLRVFNRKVEDRLPQPFRNFQGGLRRQGWQNDRELLSAVAGDEVIRAQPTAGDAGGDRLETAIASCMTVPIIKTFEMVDVDQKPAKALQHDRRNREEDESQHPDSYREDFCWYNHFLPVRGIVACSLSNQRKRYAPSK